MLDRSNPGGHQITTKTRAASPVDSVGSARSWTWGPPGVLFFLAPGVPSLAALDASSRQAFSMVFLAQVAWALLSVIWLIRFACGLRSMRLRLPAMHWTRWLAIPTVFAIVFMY